MQSDLSTEILKWVFAIVAPILSGLLVALLTKALQKIGLTVSAENQAKLEHTVASLVALTEEWASAKFKATGIAVTSAEKAQFYLSKATNILPGISDEEATQWAQTILGRAKVGAATAVSELRVAATTGAR